MHSALSSGISSRLIFYQVLWCMLDYWEVSCVLVSIHLSPHLCSLGAAYVNIFYLLRTEPKFPDVDRQLCINLTQISITLGILGGTLLELLTIYLESL